MKRKEGRHSFRLRKITSNYVDAARPHWHFEQRRERETVQCLVLLSAQHDVSTNPEAGATVPANANRSCRSAGG